VLIFAMFRTSSVSRWVRSTLTTSLPTSSSHSRPHLRPLRKASKATPRPRSTRPRRPLSDLGIKGSPRPHLPSSTFFYSKAILDQINALFPACSYRDDAYLYSGCRPGSLRGQPGVLHMILV
jgi:hypothetical protein